MGDEIDITVVEITDAGFILTIPQIDEKDLK